jgi:hypothetical protein
MNDLQLGTTSMGTDLAPAVIDTGTFGIGFSSDVYANLQSALQGSATLSSALGAPDAGFFAGAECLTTQGGLTTSQLDSTLPELNFVFPTSGGGTVTVNATATQSYLYQVDTGPVGGGVYYCWAAFDLGGNGQGSLLGDTFLQNSLTVFDIGGNQIGFAPAKGCPLPPARPPVLASLPPIKAHHRIPHWPRLHGGGAAR